MIVSKPPEASTSLERESGPGLLIHACEIVHPFLAPEQTSHANGWDIEFFASLILLGEPILSISRQKLRRVPCQNARLEMLPGGNCRLSRPATT
jgi:hypothetical protein